jgi:hypothetical protein
MVGTKLAPPAGGVCEIQDFTSHLASLLFPWSQFSEIFLRWHQNHSDILKKYEEDAISIK